MRPSERRKEILLLVDHNGQMTVDDLAQRLDVSQETIRRDLSMMAEAGALMKYHGGARPAVAPAHDDSRESPFAHRMARNADGKRRIAERAASLLQGGDTIFIDTGSTTIAMADVLALIPNLLVITNSPRIAMTVAEAGRSKVFLIGGAFNPEAGESVGPLAIEQIGNFHTRKAILTIGGMDRHGVTDYDLAEAEIARAMIARAEQVIVVADSDKFGRRAVFDVAPLGRIATVVTDRAPSSDLMEALQDAGVDVLIA